MKNSFKTWQQELLNLPLIGYVLRLVIGFFRIPRIDARVKHMRSQIRALEAVDHRAPDSPSQAPSLSDEAWNRHIPAFLNAVSTVGAFGHDLQRQSKDLQRQSEDLQRQSSDLQRQIAASEAMAQRLQALEQRLQADELAAQSTTRGVTDLQQVADRHWSSIGEIWQRLEFVRREMMFEMTVGAKVTDQADLEPKVLNPKRLEELGPTGLRVNIGCGHVPFEGYVNVDARELPGVDVQARVDNMPFEPGALAEIFSAHVLEHFSNEELRRRLLPYWFKLLASGGTFRAIVPDSRAMTLAMAAGEVSFEDFREVTYGGQEYQGDFHFNMFTPDSMKQTLAEAGFAEVDLVAEGRKNGKCFELEVVARKL